MHPLREELDGLSPADFIANILEETSHDLSLPILGIVANNVTKSSHFPKKLCIFNHDTTTTNPMARITSKTKYEPANS